MSPAERATLDRVLWHARAAAFAPAEFVGQESFVSASEVLSLARVAGVGPGVSVLDLCCGTAGPGLFITRELGCTYVGVDSSRGAIARARQRAADEGLGCRFHVARVPPVPAGPFDVILLLETLLAFRDKEPLLRAVASALREGGRFALTVEEGRPLTPAERDLMPRSDTVWLTPLPELVSALERAGLRVLWHDECSEGHLATVDALIGAYAGAAREITAVPGRRAVDEILTSHRLWSRWLGGDRVRKFALVAEKTASGTGR